MAYHQRLGVVIVMDLRDSASDYLALRRAMGYQLEGHEGLIDQFLDYLQARGGTKITVAHALAWACSPSGVRPRWHAARLAVIRGFAAFLHTHSAGAAAELIPTGLLSGKTHRPVPYLYTSAQITALIEQAHRLAPTVRGLTIATIIGLLAATGLRIGEALALDIADFDAGGHTIVVTGKYGHTRRVPVHVSTTAALNDYLRRSRSLVASPADGALFVTLNATRPKANNVESAFRALTEACHLPAGIGSAKPRLHDLRHSFAVNTLIQAHRVGADVDSRIAALATYLGHVSPVSTYWYLTASPELLDLTARRLWAHQEGNQQ